MMSFPFFTQCSIRCSYRIHDGYRPIPRRRRRRSTCSRVFVCVAAASNKAPYYLLRPLLFPSDSDVLLGDWTGCRTGNRKMGSTGHCGRFCPCFYFLCDILSSHPVCDRNWDPPPLSLFSFSLHSCWGRFIDCGQSCIFIIVVVSRDSSARGGGLSQNTVIRRRRKSWMTHPT